MGDVSEPASIDLVDLGDPADLAALHERVLAPSFPPAELIDLDGLLSGCATGELHALGVVRDGQVVAGAVGSASAPGGVVLLMYLAIAPGGRGGGIGGALLDGAVARWVEQFSPALVVAEVEHPDHHAASIEHGDPAARLRFYARHGARVLSVPYFQPRMGPGGQRVPALLLVTLYVGDPGGGGLGAGDSGAGGAPAARVSAPPLREFLEAQLLRSERTVPDAAAARALLDSVSGPWVDLFSPEDLSDVPVGLLPEG